MAQALKLDGEVYVARLIERQRDRMDASEWKDQVVPFSEKMMGYAAKMFDMKKAWKDIKLPGELEINVTEFCETARNELCEKLWAM